MIVGTGAAAKWLGLDGEKPVWEGGLGGAGVSACATCDGALPVFRGKDLAVVGGGDTAMEETTISRTLPAKSISSTGVTNFAHRRSWQRVLNNPKVEVLYNKVVTDIHDPAEKRVTGLTLEDTQTGARRSTGRCRNVRGDRT